MRLRDPFTADPALLKTWPADVCTEAKPGALRYFTIAHVPENIKVLFSMPAVLVLEPPITGSFLATQLKVVALSAPSNVTKITSGAAAEAEASRVAISVPKSFMINVLELKNTTPGGVKKKDLF